MSSEVNQFSGLTQIQKYEKIADIIHAKFPEEPRPSAGTCQTKLASVVEQYNKAEIRETYLSGSDIGPAESSAFMSTLATLSSDFSMHTSNKAM